MDATSLDTRQKIKGQIVYVSYSSKEENMNVKVEVEVEDVPIIDEIPCFAI